MLMSIERKRTDMGRSEKAVAFAFLVATMRGETITMPVVRSYYAVAEKNPVQDPNLYKILNFFHESGLITKTEIVDPAVPSHLQYDATLEGLGRFGIAYMRGLTNTYWKDVEGFQRESGTPLGYFAHGCAMGNITPRTPNG